MSLFSRQRRPDRIAASQAEAVVSFWSWWEDKGAAQTAAAIADGQPDRVTDALSSHVDAIDSGLAWELGPGAGESEHVLVVTPEGDPDLRAVARRWRRAAPAADLVWEYSDSRLADPDASRLTMNFGGVEIDVASATMSARVNGSSVDVIVYHPAFADLPEKQRTVITFILLDQVVGEAAVGTWVATVAEVSDPLPDGTPLAGLADVVRDLVTQNTDDEGRPIWALLQSEAADGLPVLALAQVPLKATSAPHLDTHVLVGVPFTDRTANGLPGADSLSPLRDLEDHLAERLGASGQVVAHETHAGTRTLHCYVDSTTPAVEQLRTAVAGWRQGTVVVISRPDPAWHEVAHLCG